MSAPSTKPPSAAPLTKALARPGCGLPWGGSAVTLGLFLFCLGRALMPCCAQTGAQREYALKAGVLYHIIDYVEWPKDSLPDSQPAIHIGLLGQLPFPECLELLEGKTVQGRKLVVKRIADVSAAADCQVLFIGASEKSRLSEIMDELQDRPVLTVSEVDGFAERGGMVNLVAMQNRIAMEINRKAVGRARLSLSSELLKLARVVTK
jgi:hypothetical protein